MDRVLWHGLVEVVVIRGKLRGWLLKVECWHGSMKHGEVDRNGHRSTPLSLVTRMHPARVEVVVDSELFLEHTHVRVRTGELRTGL